MPEDQVPKRTREARVRTEVESVGDHAVVRRVEHVGRQRLGRVRGQVGPDGNRACARAVGHLDLGAHALDPRGSLSSGDARDHDGRAPVGGRALQDSRATGAGLEVHEERVVGGARAGCESGKHGAHACEFAERDAHLVDHLRAVRAEPAAALGRVGPPLGHVGTRIGEDGDVEEDGCETRVADRSGPDRPRQRRLTGVPPELGAEQVHDPGVLGGREHAPPFGRVTGERLLADHVLPRGDRGERDLRVRVRRSGDRDRVETAQRECVVE